jgi:hypothetical protein
MIKPGMLSNTKTSIPEYIFIGMTMSGVPSTSKKSKHDKPKEKAIGNRSRMHAAKVNSKSPIMFR